MPGDRGETMIELVVAVAIMGVALVAVIGGVGTTVLVSDVHRKQATAGTAVRNYGEAIQTAVANGGYVVCATQLSYAAPAGFTAPAGYRASIVAASIRYWSGNGWQTSCSPDSGLQQLTAQVSSDDGRAEEQLVVTLRRPFRPVDPPCA